MIKTRLEEFNLYINVNNKDVAIINADPAFNEVYFHNLMDRRNNYVWYHIHPGEFKVIKRKNRVIIKNNDRQICWVDNDKIILITGGPALHINID